MASGAVLIALEGIDGAGTSTQCTRVAEALRKRGLSVHVTREPSDNPIGKLIRAALPANAPRRFTEETMALLFAADRLDHYEHEIAAREGYVITDRYLLSSLAYQAEILGEREDGGWIAELNARAKPADLTVLVDVDPALALSRRQQRGGPAERYDDQALQERLARRYRAVAARVPKCVTVDGALSIEAVTAAIVAQVVS